MTIRKGQALPLKKPSTMRQVLSAVEDGHRSRLEVIKHTKLHEGQVRSALHNLVFVGLLVRVRDKSGRSFYLPPGTWYTETSSCLCGVSSIFNVRFTTFDN